MRILLNLVVCFFVNDCLLCCLIGVFWGFVVVFLLFNVYRYWCYVMINVEGCDQLQVICDEINFEFQKIDEFWEILVGFDLCLQNDEIDFFNWCIVECLFFWSEFFEQFGEVLLWGV